MQSSPQLLHKQVKSAPLLLHWKHKEMCHLPKVTQLVAIGTWQESIMGHTLPRGRGRGQNPQSWTSRVARHRVTIPGRTRSYEGQEENMRLLVTARSSYNKALRNLSFPAQGDFKSQSKWGQQGRVGGLRSKINAWVSGRERDLLTQPELLEV